MEPIWDYITQRMRPAREEQFLLKNLPVGSTLVLKKNLEVDVPVWVKGRVTYWLRFPVYTRKGPFSKDTYLECAHCRLDHVFELSEPMVIPRLTSFEIRETRGFVLESGRGDQSYGVASLKIHNPLYPHFLGLVCYTDSGVSSDVSSRLFHELMSPWMEIQILRPPSHLPRAI